MQQRNRNGVAISTSHCGLFGLIKEACGAWIRSGVADATAHRDDVMVSEEKKARRQQKEEEENTNKTEKENAEPTDEQMVDKKVRSDIMAGEKDIQADTDTEERLESTASRNLKKNGADRAQQYSGFWKSASLQEAISKFAPNTQPKYTNTGKIIYRNDQTGIEVVYDRYGNYFRIFDTNISEKKNGIRH